MMTQAKKITFRERLVRRAAKASGLRLSETVTSDAAQELLAKLRPYHSGHPLIRLGPEGDGGYLVPDDLDGITHCFSPGVANISGFEMDLVDKGITCFLADYSVDLAESEDSRLVFDKKYIGSYSDGNYLTLDDWAKLRLPQDAGDLLLQMDIEGAEYEVFLNLSDELLKRFRIMVIEFHFVTGWFGHPFHRVIDSVFKKLLRDFSVVHIHPNNYSPAEEVSGIMVPPLMEFTFLRNDRFLNKSPRFDFPHSLDRDNTNKETLVLPDSWWT